MPSKKGKDTVFRYLIMLRYIPQSPGYTTADLIQEKLEDEGYQVTLRTIQRDLVKLSQKFPLSSAEAEDSRAIQWFWEKGTHLMDIPGMSPISALTFRLVESFCSSLLPKSALIALTPHFERARHLLKKVNGAKWSRWSDKVKVFPRGYKLTPPIVNEEVLDELYRAVLSEKQVEINYLKRGEKTGRKHLINPYGLVFQNEIIYLVCSFTKYNKPVHIPLHRVKSVKIKEDLITIPDGFTLDEFLKKGHFSYLLSDEEIQLEAIFDPFVALHLQESPLSDDQEYVEMDDGKVLIKASVKNTQELRWWLLGFGSQVEVLKPDSLKVEIKNQIMELHEIYFSQKA